MPSSSVVTIHRRKLLTLSSVLTWSLAVQGSPARAAQTGVFSSLSDGRFEKQLSVPEHDPLDAASALYQSALKTYEKLPFDPGERMRFIVTYLGVSGGAAEVTLHAPVKHKDTWAHRLTGEVKSARWYRWIMQIHDSIEVLIQQAEDFVPARFYINQLEGSFKQSKLIEFDVGNSTIHQRTKRSGRDEAQASFPFVNGSKDALGALYYLRAQLAASTPPPLSLDIPIFTSEKTWTGKATYLGSDTRKIANKTYETDVYRLITTFGGLMEQRGDIKMWFSRDERRIPLYIEATVRFGSIKVTLDEWTPGELKKNQMPAIRHDL